MIAVDTGHIGTSGQAIRERWIAKLTVHAGPQHPETGAPVAEFPEHPSREVVRQRLDFGARSHPGVGHRRVLAVRKGFDEAEAPVVARLAGDFRGKEDACAGGRIDELAGSPTLRRPADPARVKQDRLDPIETEPIVRSEVPEVVEDLRALDEER